MNSLTLEELKLATKILGSYSYDKLDNYKTERPLLENLYNKLYRDAIYKYNNPEKQIKSPEEVDIRDYFETWEVGIQ